MRHGSLFSGIGGFDLAAEWMGWENIFQVEWDDYAQKVLKKNFPNVTKYTDIKEFDATPYRGTVDIISGGFPCQPFSAAGKRKGTDDSRYLWPEMLRVIREVRPSYVVGENVAGLLSMENGRTLDRILADLEDEGYTVESFIIPACGVGAWHRRDRIWICAISNTRHPGPERGIKEQLQGWSKSRPEFTPRNLQSREDAKNVPMRRSPKYGYWNTEPDVGRVANGIPNRVDRLKGLGNAIVPQVAYEIFKAIDDI